LNSAQSDARRAASIATTSRAEFGSVPLAGLAWAMLRPQRSSFPMARRLGET
jgi:hypothetical protein